MIATDITPRPDIRLERIKFVSRIAKYISIVFLIFSTAYFLLSLYASLLFALEYNAGMALYMIIYQVILCIWYWKLAQLFQCYERGLIFGSRAMRCIKNLGFLAVAGWVLINLYFRLFPNHQPAILPTESELRMQITHNFRMGFFAYDFGAGTPMHAFRMGFFTFDFGTGIDFGPLLAGVVIILIAWIMDEGRKIQEEQALTV